jgi:hypothetical protein
MNENLLTVIMPVGNINQHIENILRITAATNQINLKMIIVHDRQIDDNFNSIELLGSLNQHSNIQIITGEFGSPGAARNAGIPGVDTPWVCFWDCDDWPILNSVTKIMQFAQNSSSDLIITDFQVKSETSQFLTNKIYRLKQNNLLKHLAAMPGIWRIYFRQEAIANLKFPHLSMAEDQIFICELLSNPKKIVILNEITYIYNRSITNQLTRSKESLSQLSCAFNISLSNISKFGPGESNIRFLFCGAQYLSILKFLGFKAKFSATCKLIMIYNKIGLTLHFRLILSIWNQIISKSFKF